MAPTNQRRNRADSLADMVSRVTKPLFGRRGLADGAIVREWRNIVGETIARHCQPDRVSYTAHSRSEGLLHLRVGHSAMATELQHLEPQLIERINTHFGYRAVARLRFVHGPLPERTTRAPSGDPELTETQERAMAQTLDAIEDPALRDALARLGRAVNGQRPKG